MSYMTCKLRNTQTLLQWNPRISRGHLVLICSEMVLLLKLNSGGLYPLVDPAINSGVMSFRGWSKFKAAFYSILLLSDEKGF